MLAVAYYNLGTEEECTNNLYQAKSWYEQSLTLLKKYQPDAPLVYDLEKILAKF